MVFAREIRSYMKVTPMAVPNIPLIRRSKIAAQDLSAETAALLDAARPSLEPVAPVRRQMRLMPVLFIALGALSLGGLAWSVKNPGPDLAASTADMIVKHVPAPVLKKAAVENVVAAETVVAAVQTTPVATPVVIEPAVPLSAWPVIGEIQPKPVAKPVEVAAVVAPAPVVPEPPVTPAAAPVTPPPHSVAVPVTTLAPAIPPPVPVETAAIAPPATPAPVAQTGDQSAAACVADLQAQAKKLKVLFGSGSTKVSAADKKQIAAFAAAVAKCPAAKVEVAGHTDGAGADNSNTDLSLKRAEEVARVLGESGVDASRFKAAGYGTSELVVRVKAPKIRKSTGGGADFSSMQFGPVGNTDTGGVSPEQARRIVAERNAPNRRVELRVTQ